MHPRCTLRHRQVHEELIRKAFEADESKPLPPALVGPPHTTPLRPPPSKSNLFASMALRPPLQIDRGNNNVRQVQVGEILLDVAKYLGKDMSKWKQLVEDSARKRANRAAHRAGGGAGPRPGMDRCVLLINQGHGLAPRHRSPTHCPSTHLPASAMLCHAYRPAPALPPTGVTTLSEVPPPGVIPVPVVLPDMSGRPRKPYKDMDVPKVSQQPAATPIAAWSSLPPSPHRHTIVSV